MQFVLLFAKFWNVIERNLNDAMECATSVNVSRLCSLDARCDYDQV